MAGLVFGDRLSDPLPTYLPWLFGAVFLALLLLMICFPPLALWAGCAFLSATGLCLTTLLSPRITTPPVPPHLLHPSVQHLAGVIIEEPRRYPDRIRFVLRLTAYTVQGRDHPAQGKVLLTVKIPESRPPEGKDHLSENGTPTSFSAKSAGEKVPDQTPPAEPIQSLYAFIPGDPVRCVCRLHPIEGYHNPGGYPIDRVWARKGIRVSGFLEDPGLIVLSGPNERPPWLRKLSRLRIRVAAWIDARVSFPASSLARAVLTGDQSRIPREIQEAYARAGVSHLLAFSGLNLSLVGGLSFFLFRRLLSLSERMLLFLNVRRWSLIASFFPVLGYALLSGMNPPAFRAFIMVTLVILAFLLQRYSDLLNSLALAALLLLLITPEALFGPSFQLSFVAVWAIGYLLPTLWNPSAVPGRTQSGPLRGIVHYGWGIFSVSLVCQLATAPLVIWWFHQLSLAGLICNMVFVPLTGLLITPLGLLGLISAPFSASLSSFLFSLMDLLLQATLWGVRLVSTFPLASLNLPRPAFPEMAAFFAFLSLLFHFRRLSRPFLWLPLSAAAVVALFFLPHLQDVWQRPFRVHFLDVGHGSAVFIEFPKGEKMLIDGGGSSHPDFDMGERVVAPFLWSKKIRTLDLLVLTHPHPDHLNGLPFILSHFKVKEVWTNGEEVETEAFYRFQGLIRRKGIPLLSPPSGWLRRFDDLDIEVLQGREEDRPFAPTADCWHRQNDHSLVLRIGRKGERLLFPADLEAEGEKRLLSKGWDLKSRILQVPHHGSLTSSTEAFLRSVCPSWAVISGRSSPRFHLPHPEVIQRYVRHGSRVLRTDQEGAITFTQREGTWRVAGFKRGLLAVF